MASIQITLRDLVKAQVAAAQATYIVTNLDIENVFLPKENLEDPVLAQKPFVKFVAIGFLSDRKRLLRNRSYEVEVPVQVAIQKKLVSAFDDNEIKIIVELCEQITRTCEQDFVGSSMRFSWERTEPLRDDNGLTYSYQDLMTRGVFQSIFTPVYKFVSS